MLTGATAAMLLCSPLHLDAAELPEGWAASTTEDGREYYYNLETKESQFSLPEGAVESAKAKAKRISDQNNLNKVVPFDALPAVPVDRVSKYAVPELDPESGCGDSDYRSNSVECGMPAKNLVEDVVEKTGNSLPILGDISKEKQRSAKFAERDRMLQQAELKALEKTDIFKKLKAKTEDPELAAKRQKAIDEVTLKNDIGASRAPWSPPDRPPQDERISKEGRRTLREGIGDTLAGLNPFGGKKAAPKAAPVAAASVDLGDDDEEE